MAVGPYPDLPDLLLGTCGRRPAATVRGYDRQDDRGCRARDRDHDRHRDPSMALPSLSVLDYRRHAALRMVLP